MKQVKLRTGETKWCPLQVRILMHAYAIAEEYDRPSAAFNDYLDKFVHDGIIEIVPIEVRTSGMKLTPKGEKLVEMILNVPEPVNLWMDPRTLEEK